MFASRIGFRNPTIVAPVGGFGNNALFPNLGDQYLSVPGATNLVTWKATTGFTIEYWIYLTEFPSGAIQPGPGNQDTAGTNYWSFGPGSAGELQFYYWGSGTKWFKTASSTLSINTWYNVAFVATTSGSSTTVSMYVNGVRENIQLDNAGTFEQTKTVVNGVVSAGTPFRMGKYGGALWNGNMDNLRVSNVNRYSGASYTVATAPFTSDASTQLLMICDGANGSTTFTDSSGFARTVTNNLDRVVVSDARANHS